MTEPNQADWSEARPTRLPGDLGYRRCRWRVVIAVSRREPIDFEKPFALLPLFFGPPRPRGDFLRTALRFLSDPTKCAAKTRDVISHATWAVHDVGRVKHCVGAVEGAQRLVVGVPNRW